LCDSAMFIIIDFVVNNYCNLFLYDFNSIVQLDNNIVQSSVLQ